VQGEDGMAQRVCPPGLAASYDGLAMVTQD
jgi:hypothetical protein